MVTIRGGAKMESKLREIAEAVGKGKVVRVGFLETATYPTGEKVAQVAFWNEYGTKTTPPRPFFRNMIEAKKPKWGKDMGAILKFKDYDINDSLQVMGMRMSEQLSQSIVETNAPPLSQITLMLRKMRIGKTDAPTSGAMVGEAARRVAAGESTAGINAKPLIYSNVMRSSVAFDIQEVS